ncbi:hypothetical protein ACN6TW_11535 [Acinetobacter radioresistens]|nr:MULTISPECIES: hypothetical protein [Acinetobacter]EEY87455.1 hypothetical protein HMPREF0018_00202 [Acinetobacter radioresistens SH164]EXB76103.1 AAA domain protein [Acinetobacter sp. 272263]MCK4096571.1 hypothetical protein [Acinetobacter radioresistens]MCK4100534.1 hypothetical protein [Acinetobacter radioresistens]MCK4106430.1 hypothetical protein [Acinetobacter radioresistens]
MKKAALIIERLIVHNFMEEVACDLKFKKGLNIISGENSSGKSTILDFIAYTLGAENIKFKKAAKQCTNSFIQVNIFNQKITLMRKVNEKSQSGLSVFFGSYDESIKMPNKGWMNFPYKNSQEKFSFSKLIFEYLNYPMPLAEDSLITMNQILRVVYADQMYTHPIFRFEKWDSSEKRAAIRDFIFGIFEDELYDLQITLKNLKKELETKNIEYKSIKGLVERTHGQLSIDEIQDKILTKTKVKARLINEIEHYENIFNQHKIDIPSQITQQELLKIELESLNTEIIEIENQSRSLQYDIVDSENFIKELNQRNTDIQNAKNTQQQIQNFKFKFCPSCYNPIDSIKAEGSCCHLCTSPLSTSLEDGVESISALLKMQTEIMFQKDESERLLSRRRRMLFEINSSLNEKKSKLLDLQAEFNSIASKWHSEFELGLINLHRQATEINAELIKFENLYNLFKEIEFVGNQKNSLIHERNQIERRIQSLERLNFHQREKVLAKINSKLHDLLIQDLERQDEFINPEKVDIKFEDNVIFINNVGYFSQSSLVLIRHLFHLALLSVSDKEDSMRFPQLLILDGLNDGGLEAKRAYNLQRIILNESQKLNEDFQIIAATSEVSKELNLSDHIIATFTEKNRSLKLS